MIPAGPGTWYSDDAAPSKLERNFDTAAGKLSVFFVPPAAAFSFPFVSRRKETRESWGREGRDGKKKRVLWEENRLSRARWGNFGFQSSGGHSLLE